MLMDVFGRALMAETLVLDDTGKLEQMNVSVGHNHDAGVNFGDQIRREARKLDE